MKIRISSRKSDLARIQAYVVGHALQTANPALEITYTFKKSLGDIDLTTPLARMEDKGVFTDDFRQDLLEGATDLVVHSWKDLPTEAHAKTVIACTLPRADARDLFLFKKRSWDKVVEQKQATLFSSSPRRIYNSRPFLAWALPAQIDDVEFKEVRGNVPTRIRKLLEHDVDGLIVAKAALDRLLSVEEEEFRETKDEIRQNLSECYWMIAPFSVNPCAPAQGALAIEVLRERQDVLSVLEPISCADTFSAVSTEREILAHYGGGCHQKIGATVLKRPYGEIRFLKGLTDGGEVLDSLKLLAKRSIPETSADKAWPPCKNGGSFFSRTPLNPSMDDLPPNSCLWIAKADALPTAWDVSPNQVVWTSGIKTWKKLAQLGVWVNGTADSLGEDECPRLSTLLGEEPAWTKLTHSTGYHTEGVNVVAGYELRNTADYPNLSGKTHFFWKSGSTFLRALELYPEITDAWHGCGPGNTFKIISGKLGSTERLQVFLDHKQWLQELVK
ncbi:hydroxymethylbilane synthase [Oligoflexia bacterium]|nr:hydroxymethylbilane synthase [Oligoflexia bacterium]